MMTLSSAVSCIDLVETIDVVVPRRARNRMTTSYATLPDAHHALVRIRAGDHVGIGEAPTELWWTGEDAASVRNAVHRYLAPAIVGSQAEPRLVARAMNAALAGNAYAKAAVEMAIWDLVGRAAGLPLCTLLGGGPHPVPIKYVIGMVEPGRAREEAAWGIEAGFTMLKVKIGGELGADLARVEAVVEVANGAARVGVDANGGWSLTTAIAGLAPLAALGTAFLEQPVDARFPDAMREVTARSTIPVVAHESVFSLRDGLDALQRPLAHVWALTPSTHGGLVATLDLLGAARVAGIPCLLGSTVELGIATAFLAQIGAAFDTIRESCVASDVIGPLYHEADIVGDGVRLEGGFAYVPDGPGLGVDLDEDALATFAVDSWR